MAKTYNTFTNVSTGDVLTATNFNNLLTNTANYRVPPAARISASSMTGISDGVATLVTLGTVDYTTDSDMTTTGSRITTTTAGIYLVSGQGASDSGSQSDVFVGLAVVRFNSSNVEQEEITLGTRSANIGYGNALTPSGILSCSANDYLRLRVNIDGTAAGTRTLNTPKLSAIWLGQAS